jgi:hypothetical protein
MSLECVANDEFKKATHLKGQNVFFSQFLPKGLHPFWAIEGHPMG